MCALGTRNLWEHANAPHNRVANQTFVLHMRVVQVMGWLYVVLYIRDPRFGDILMHVGKGLQTSPSVCHLCGLRVECSGTYKSALDPVTLAEGLGTSWAG